ncbi:MAG: hypothetical protein HY908_04440 [Myxococcales bacterium]|nr:hypothetical protein [Myxococcales bacterium]
MAADLLEKLLDAAEAHGADSEPDHEVGDLQGILRSCWKLMTAAQRREVYRGEHAELLGEWIAE